MQKDLKDLLEKVAEEEKIRECNNCIGCCIAFAIPEVEKNMYDACKHLNYLTPKAQTDSDSRGNCSVYEDRPKVCADFTCLWRQGFGDREKDWPMKSGLFFVAHPVNGPIAFELWNSAASQASETVTRMKEETKYSYFIKESPSPEGLPIL